MRGFRLPLPAAAACGWAWACSVAGGGVWPGPLITLIKAEAQHEKSLPETTNTIAATAASTDTGAGTNIGAGTDKRNDCERYNDLLQRLQWADRRTRCNSHPSCVFVGRRVLGTCVLKDAETRPHNVKPNIDENDGTSPYALVAELISPNAQGHEDLAKVQVLITGRLAETAIDSLKNAQQMTERLAKTLVIDVLENPVNLHLGGTLLGSLFSYESVCGPTRWLVYYSLALPQTRIDTQALVKANVRYQLAQQYTHSNLVQLLTWLLHEPYYVQHYYEPLTLWMFLRENSSLYDVALTQTLQIIPLLKPQTVSAVKHAMQSTLRSPEVQSFARDLLLEMLTQTVSRTSDHVTRTKRTLSRRSTRSSRES